MGRPQTDRTSTLHNVFRLNQEYIINHGKVLPPTAEVWRKLSDEINAGFNPKSLYTAALKWWHKINIPESNEKPDAINDVSIMDSSFDSNMSEESDQCEQNSVKFTVKLSWNVWKVIQPVERTYSRKCTGVRKYTVLNPGVWTNVVVDEIAKQRLEIPCGWCFKNNKCYQSGDVYITMSAKCSTCAAILSGVIKEKPQENDTVKIHTEIRGMDLIRHEKTKNKNVKVTGDFAKQLYSTQKTATVVKREIYSRKAKLFRKPYGRMITANAIRCGKYRLGMKQKMSVCPYTSLTYLKASKKYINTIRMIGLDPFFTFFASPDQVKLYKVYKKKNRYTKIACDATGGVANKLDRPGGEKSGDIYMYSMVISDTFQVPINVALSEIHDANFLTFWLSEWVRRTSEISNEFTCDISMALLNAGARSFGLQASVADYIDVLFDLLLNENSHKRVPPCFIRIDIAHFIKNVATCEAIRNSPKKVRDFYIRCVTLLMLMDDLKKAEEHIFSVLIVATSLTEGTSKESHTAVPCEIHKMALINKITGNISEFDEEYWSHIEEETSHFTPDNTLNCTKMYLWLNAIEQDAAAVVTSFDDGDRDNIMYNLEFAKYFLGICKLYPLWSAICCKLFPGSEFTSSTANAECNFKVVKQALGDTIPCSVDKLVQQCMDLTDGMIIEASQNYIEFVCNTNTNNDESVDITNTNTKSGTSELLLTNNNNNADTTAELEIVDKQTINDIDTSALIDSTASDTNDFICTTDVSTTDLNHTENSSMNGVENIRSADSISCPACRDKNWPTGAHKCVRCNKNVHILAGCSISCGYEEGYGETRICMSCSCKPQERPAVSELSNVEKWSRKSKRETKKSKYLQPVPHWNLNLNINKKVSIGFLTNGNMSLRVFKSKKKLMALKNTCVFDAIAQVLATAFAYVPTYRLNTENQGDDIFKIALALAKSEHMNKVNNMRAQLLSEKLDNVYEMEVASMIKIMLKNSPSCTEVFSCHLCDYSINRTFPLISVDQNIFKNDFTQLKNAIIGTFQDIETCRTCNLKMHLNRQFKDHLFIQVLSTPLNRDIKNEDIHQLDRIPFVLTIETKTYILFGAILFVPEFCEGDIGHYVSAVKLNENWILYDDLKPKEMYCSSKRKFVIDTLFYMKHIPDLQENVGHFSKLERQPKLKRKTKTHRSDLHNKKNTEAMKKPKNKI